MLKNNIEDVPLEIKAILAETKISFGEILGLQEGDVIQFPNKSLKDELDIIVQNRRKFTGKPGIYEGKTAIQIMNVLESVSAEEFFEEEENE